MASVWTSIHSPSSLRINLKLSSHPMAPTKTIYFGYGSNLWLHQMRQRCPTSKYLGIARLKGYKWIIYDRGYANIVEIDESREAAKHDYTREVWGLVYSLEEEDERRLDGNEGVPVAYAKEWIECEFWERSEEDTDGREILSDTESELGYHFEGRVDVTNKSEKVDMLVYVNRDYTDEAEPKEEYIYRMNMGIRDAVHEGVPKEYVKQVLRKFIPDVEDERVKEVARRQALEFEDET